MSEPIGPALSAKEWEVADRMTSCGPTEKVAVVTNWQHGLAALCLDGQPFGFRREDVEALRAAAQAFQHEALWQYDCDAKALRSLADRIAALLRPR